MTQNKREEGTLISSPPPHTLNPHTSGFNKNKQSSKQPRRGCSRDSEGVTCLQESFYDNIPLFSSYLTPLTQNEVTPQFDQVGFSILCKYAPDSDSFWEIAKEYCPDLYRPKGAAQSRSNRYGFVLTDPNSHGWRLLSFKPTEENIKNLYILFNDKRLRNRLTIKIHSIEVRWDLPLPAQIHRTELEATLHTLAATLRPVNRQAAFSYEAGPLEYKERSSVVNGPCTCYWNTYPAKRRKVSTKIYAKSFDDAKTWNIRCEATLKSDAIQRYLSLPKGFPRSLAHFESALECVRFTDFWLPLDWPSWLTQANRLAQKLPANRRTVFLFCRAAFLRASTQKERLQAARRIARILHSRRLQEAITHPSPTKPRKKAAPPANVPAWVPQPATKGTRKRQPAPVVAETQASPVPCGKRRRQYPAPTAPSTPITEVQPAPDTPATAIPVPAAPCACLWPRCKFPNSKHKRTGPQK